MFNYTNKIDKEHQNISFFI